MTPTRTAKPNPLTPIDRRRREVRPAVADVRAADFTDDIFRRFMQRMGVALPPRAR